MHRLLRPLLILGLIALIATETIGQASAAEPDQEIQVLRRLRQICRRPWHRPARTWRIEITDDAHKAQRAPETNVIIVGSISMPHTDSDSNIPILDAIAIANRDVSQDRSAAKLAAPATDRVFIEWEFVTPRIIISPEEEQPLGLDVP